MTDEGAGYRGGVARSEGEGGDGSRGDRRPLAIIDIDGVVADVRHRLRYVERRPKDWDSFFAAAPDDPPHDEGLALVRELVADHDVVYLTGRPEHCRRDTETWLEQHGIGGHRVLMRPRGDRRPAATVKRELLDRLAADRDVAVVVDDDPYVVASYDAGGYPTRLADWEQRPPEDDLALLEAQETEGRT